MYSKTKAISLQKVFVFVSMVLSIVIMAFQNPRVASASSVNAWWPTSGAYVSGVQPFKAELQGVSVDQYQMYWQVDGGALVKMDSNYTGYPHKEASVDVSGWRWNTSGNYTITFVAKDWNGNVIGQAVVPIHVVVTAANITTNTTTSVPLAEPAVSATINNSDPLSGMTLWVNPHSSAASQAAVWSSSDPTDAQLMRVLAAQSTASWFGGWNSNVGADVHSLVTSAQNAGAVPVMVAYNIPGRDCGGYSAGGATDAASYNSWIQSFAAGIGSARVIVILEPDSLATILCLSSADAQTRLTLLSNAVNTLKANANTKVYIDAGHAGWIGQSQMANLLRSANISRADGFALNVSNFGWTSDNTTYGTQISSDLGGAHFVIDTSRNGLGPTPDNQWCNPSGRATGVHPTTSTGNTLIDALLWLKVPGESDGSCNGGPSAGTWWPSYAVGLAQRAQ